MRAVTVPLSGRSSWRGLLRWSGVGLVVSALIVFGAIPSQLIPTGHGIALALIGLMALWAAVHGRGAAYSPIVLSVLFVLGYPLRMVVEVVGGREFQDAVGQFDFTSGEWTRVVGIAFSGMLGLAIGWTAARRVTARWIQRDAVEGLPSNAARVARWAVGWFVGSVGLSLLMWWLGVGQTGIRQESELPYRLGGIMSSGRMEPSPAESITRPTRSIEMRARRGA